MSATHIGHIIGFLPDDGQDSPDKVRMVQRDHIEEDDFPQTRIVRVDGKVYPEAYVLRALAEYDAKMSPKIAQNRTPRDAKAIAAERWQVWQLAFDEQTYGENAGKWIITTEDGEDEVLSGRVFKYERDALAIVNDHNVGLLGTITIERGKGPC